MASTTTPNPTRRTLRPRPARPSSSAPTPSRLVLKPPRHRSILKPFEPPLISAPPPDTARYSHTTVFLNTCRNNPAMPAAAAEAGEGNAPRSSRAARAAARAARGSHLAWRARRLEALRREEALRWLEELNEEMIAEEAAKAEGEQENAGETAAGQSDEAEKGDKGGEGGGDNEEARAVGFAQPLASVRPFPKPNSPVGRAGMDYQRDEAAGANADESSSSEGSADDLTEWWKEEDREMMAMDGEEEEAVVEAAREEKQEPAVDDDVVPTDISPSALALPSAPEPGAPRDAPPPADGWLADLQAVQRARGQAGREHMWQEAYVRAGAGERAHAQEKAGLLDGRVAREEAARQGTPEADFLASICHVFSPSFDSSPPSLDYDKRAEEQGRGQDLTLESQLDLPSASADHTEQHPPAAAASTHPCWISIAADARPETVNPADVLSAAHDNVFRRIPTGPVGEWDRFMAFDFCQAENVEDMVRGGGLWGLEQVRVDLGVEAVDEMLGRRYGSFVGLEEVDTTGAVSEPEPAPEPVPEPEPEPEPLPSGVQEANDGEDVDVGGEEE